MQIVLCDHGKGIYDTLIKAYKKDAYLNKQKYYKNGERCDDEPFVLRYSLDKLSSRHTEKSRLHFHNIPRGLAWVYDVVREYRGFLSIRSGSARIGISFYQVMTENLDMIIILWLNSAGRFSKLFYPNINLKNYLLSIWHQSHFQEDVLIYM